MTLFHWITGSILGLVWLTRLIDTLIGLPSVADIARPEWDRTPSHGFDQPAPRVTIVVPARNEEESLAQCLESLLALDYPNYEIIAVNDRSTDRTGEIMDNAASQPGAHSKLRVLRVYELPHGWLGKTHAMWLAAKEATGEWILFTDGDIIFRADALRRAVFYALTSHADHLVLYPTIVMKTFGERMMISFFQIMFVFGHRAWKVADPRARDHIGVGAFNLIRRSAYEGLGTYEELRLEVIDDIMLGKAVKAHGFAQRNVFGSGLLTLRWAKSAMGVVNNLTKNVFALMQYRWQFSVLAAVLAAILNLVPFWGVIAAPGWSRLGYGVALASLAMLYVRMAKTSGISPIFFFSHPLSAVMFIYTILRSTLLAVSQNGVTWRGTKYSLAELRAARNK